MIFDNHITTEPPEEARRRITAGFAVWLSGDFRTTTDNHKNR